MRALTIMAAAALVPAVARGDGAAGQVVAEEGRVEILHEPAKVGQRVDLPEGWYRVEEAGTEDRDVGSFAVVSSKEFAAAGIAATETDTTSSGDAQVPAGAQPQTVPPGDRAAHECREERSAYLAELWKQQGIEVKDPDAVMAGLDGGAAVGASQAWLAISTDAFRPLAWSPALRDRAEALARCVRGK